MADEKKPYRVVQSGRDGAPIEVAGEMVNFNDTVYLTDGEAKYLVGLSIEPAFPANLPTPVGEHREKPIDVDESTRPMQEVKPSSEDVRSEKRAPRSTPARS